MAFAVHVNLERCTGCGNCVAACPVNALELHAVDPATKEKIYVVRDGRSISLDFKTELCAGCGVCVMACPYKVITLSGKGACSPIRA
ncbi:MAG: Ferredoxin-type protein NapF [Methanoregula sp. SKADARSKE-2]|nr:MAG: Ferredoxin-type protein NapF [Methanoregula sp. SKADARSKE-2]